MKKVFILRMPAQYLSSQSTELEREMGDKVKKEFEAMMANLGTQGLVLPSVWDAKRDSYLYDIEVIETE